MTDSYHLAELRIALDRTHPRHILPPPLPVSERVLDIGCGAGQTLIAAYPDRVSFGIDIDIDALRLGTSLTQQVRFVLGRAEALPLAGGRFDMVLCRVALPYTDVNAALREIRRVMKAGGLLWLTLHSLGIPWKQAKASNWKGKIYFVYVLLNGLLFHLLQRQLSIRGRQEVFFTQAAISRALRGNGFENIRIERGAHFLVMAQAAGGH